MIDHPVVTLRWVMDDITFLLSKKSKMLKSDTLVNVKIVRHIQQHNEHFTYGVSATFLGVVTRWDFLIAKALSFTLVNLSAFGFCWFISKESESKCFCGDPIISHFGIARYFFIVVSIWSMNVKNGALLICYFAFIADFLSFLLSFPLLSCHSLSLFFACPLPTGRNKIRCWSPRSCCGRFFSIGRAHMAIICHLCVCVFVYVCMCVSLFGSFN